MARGSPSLTLKNWLYRRMGMKVGAHVSVGLEVTVDIFFPELITIEDDVIVGFGTTILCHEFLAREYRTGPVVIGRGAVVGAKCLILPGVTVAPGAVVSAMSLVNRDAEGFVGGVPARPLRGPHDPA
jgi:acetyltransferase-like isoleucine patch superfamily enzyme